MKILQLLHKLKTQIQLNRIRKGRNGFEKKYLAFGNFPKITKEELREIRKTWPMWKINKKDITFARVYKKFHGFSPYVIGNWHTYLLRKAFNPYEQLSSFENKAMFDVYFPDIPFPNAYIRRIQNVYYDSKMNVLSEEQAVNILLQYDSYVIKPAFGIRQGTGVQKIYLNSEEKSKTILKSFENQHSDFIAQEVLEQHKDVAALNPTCLNCCRVTSVYIDGKFSQSTVLKIGKKDSHVDNWYNSYLCGVDKNGIALEIGYDHDLQTVTQTDNGIVIKGFKLPCYDKMISLIEKLHKTYFPNCGIIGWDVFVDKNSNVRVIEMNLTVPGLLGEQLASGEFFKEFRDSIVFRLSK